MKQHALVIALLIVLVAPAHADVLTDWWNDYATNSKVVTLPDGKQLNLFCQGEGTPVVMMESGLGLAGITAWRNVQTAIGRVTKACAYDRAGIWKSAPTDGPRDGGAEADDLAALLKAAELPAPYVIVGHSYGGFITRLYASRHTSDVAGLLLIDPSSAYQLTRQSAIPALATLIAANDTRARDCAVDPRPADFVAKCESPAPADMPPAMTQLYNSNQDPGPASHIARERAAWNALSSDLLEREKTSLGAIPFVVLNRDPSLLDPALSPADGLMLERLWLQMHMEIMDLSSDSQLHIVPGAGHGIQSDRPDAVINAVSDMVLKIRSHAQ